MFPLSDLPSHSGGKVLMYILYHALDQVVLADSSSTSEFDGPYWEIINTFFELVECKCIPQSMTEFVISWTELVIEKTDICNCSPRSSSKVLKYRLRLLETYNDLVSDFQFLNTPKVLPNRPRYPYQRAVGQTMRELASSYETADWEILAELARTIFKLLAQALENASSHTAGSQLFLDYDCLKIIAQHRPKYYMHQGNNVDIDWNPYKLVSAYITSLHGDGMAVSAPNAIAIVHNLWCYQTNDCEQFFGNYR
ncbi:hypothetical protein GYMLUDRAFT_240544 [Collybiopsis luxurians FD-317 M1]|nr:hypothetical protein GYMLUDRAFT_240544 [Collybiopsis luxurians FD-317 M1]